VDVRDLRLNIRHSLAQESGGPAFSEKREVRVKSEVPGAPAQPIEPFKEKLGAAASGVMAENPPIRAETSAGHGRGSGEFSSGCRSSDGIRRAVAGGSRTRSGGGTPGGLWGLPRGGDAGPAGVETISESTVEKALGPAGLRGPSSVGGHSLPRFWWWCQWEFCGTRISVRNRRWRWCECRSARRSFQRPRNRPCQQRGSDNQQPASDKPAQDKWKRERTRRGVCRSSCTRPNCRTTGLLRARIAVIKLRDRKRVGGENWQRFGR